jgi:hypothetical protein
MQRSSVQPKKLIRVQLWIFLQNFAGVKEIIEPRVDGSAAPATPLLLSDWKEK